MNVTLRFFLISLMILFIILVIHKIKIKKISMRYAVLWILISIVLIVCAAIPQIIIWISKQLGFKAASNMIFLLGFFAISYLLFSITLTMSKQKEYIKELIQEVSILKRNENKNEERK